jgi:undecaprenyl-diphosphatase
MNILESIIFGIVEGITEFLPVSSTGHLLLTAKLLDHSQTDFLKSFEIAIQLGAILSVLVIYGKSLLRQTAVWKRILAAFIPTAVIGFLLYKVVRELFFESHTLVLQSLFWGGLFLIIFDTFHKETRSHIDKIEDIPYRTAILIGVFQSFALIPGVSRAAATIIGGLILGIKRKPIVEFSFLLAIPTMLSATGFDILKNAACFSSEHFIYLGIGFAVSFIVALFAIQFLLKFIQRHNFILFGVYRMVLSILWRIFGK